MAIASRPDGRAPTKAVKSPVVLPPDNHQQEAVRRLGPAPHGAQW